MIEAAFRANANNSPFQDINAFQVTEVQFPSKEFDTSNQFANNRFTCKPAFNGKYLCLSVCVSVDTEQSQIRCEIQRSTDAGANWTAVAGAVAAFSNYVNANSGPLLLATGHIYRVRIFCSEGGSLGDTNVVFAPGVTYFSGYILSGVQAFRAINTTIDDGANNTEVPLPTVIFDTAGAFSANRFTVPSGWDGKYLHLTGGAAFQATPSFSEIALQRSTDAGGNFSTIAGCGGEATRLITAASGPVLLTTGHVYRMTALCSNGGNPQMDASEAEEMIFLSGWVDLT